MGVFALAPTSLASLPLLGGVPLTLFFNQWTYRLVAAGAPVAGFPLCKPFLLFMLPLGLPSSLGMVSLKAGHLHSLTLGIRLSSQPHCLFSLRYSSSLATAPPSTRSA